MLRSRPAVPIAISAVLATAPCCASHPADFAAAVSPCLSSGNLAPAEKLFLKNAARPGRNQLLYLYEMATLYRMQGNLDKSIELFAAADQVAQTYETKAIVSASGAAGQVGAALSNDTTLPWEGVCQDKVMARTINAMNYLAKLDLEGARVEVRKAEEYQVQEREKRQKALAKAAKKDEKAAAPAQDQAGKAPAELGNPGMAAKYQQMYSFVRNVRNSYENAFTYYLSSQIYRAQGPAGLNDALVDIKRAYQLAPEVPAVQEAYLDIAAQAHEDAALEELKARLGLAPGFQPADPGGTGTVVVLFEAGFVPRLSEVAIDLPVSGQLFSLAFPIYREFETPQPVLRIQTPGGTQSTSRVTDLRPMMLKSLQERMPEILARGTLGAVAKIEAQKEIKKNLGFFGGLAATIATKAVTSADLRSWLSLPAELQTTQFHLQPGPAELTLSSFDWSEKVALDVAPGTTTFVMVKAVPGFKNISTASVRPGA